MERDLNTLSLRIIQIISTHTLTWSVTEFSCNCLLKLVISTHTLTWSVTEFLFSETSCKYISTHTLTWSVTDSK